MQEVLDTDEFHYIVKIKNFKNSLASRTIRKIHIYDFDNTLFHSPFPSRELWSSKVTGRLISSGLWYRNIATLTPPFVPKQPNDIWFNPEVVTKALDSISQPEVVSVIMTGRLHHVFADRIHEILESHSCKQLDKFDLEFFKEDDPNRPVELRHSSTMSFKLAVLHHILQVFPTTTEIEMFDDRPNHVSQFRKELKRLEDEKRIATGIVHHVIEGHSQVVQIDADVEKQMVNNLIATHPSIFQSL